MISAVLIMILYRKQTDTLVKPSNTIQKRPKKTTKALKKESMIFHLYEREVATTDN